MNLELSNNLDHLRCQYTPNQHHLPRYSVETARGTTTLKRLDTFSQSDVVGRIKFRVFRSDLIEHAGKRSKALELLKKEAWLCGTPNRSRIFEGPNGVKYKWILGFEQAELVLYQGDEHAIPRIPPIPVTTFRPYEPRLFGPPPPNASLEIKPEGLPFLDLIVLTFLYIEHKRKRALRHRSGSSPAGGSGDWEVNSIGGGGSTGGCSNGGCDGGGGGCD